MPDIGRVNNIHPNEKHLGKLAYTRQETAQLLGISAITVDRLTKRGLLRPSRATRRPIYPYWEIERFLRETSGDVAI